MNAEIKERVAAINSGIIPEGYKKTKVGIVPVEWDIKALGKISQFLDNQRKPVKENERSSGIYPYYGASGIIDYVDDYLFDGEYILLGEDGANIVMRSSPLAFKVKGKMWINNHAHVISPNDNCNIDFLVNILESLNYEKYNSGTAQPKLNREVCESITLPFPPLPEQQKIAEILSTQDKLIELQEKKIEQLKELKKAYLQKMFPQKGSKYPELRFKGFTEPWEQRKLGELADIVGGGTPSTSNDDYWDGDIDWYAPAEIADQIYVASSERKITQQGYDNSSAKMLPVGTVLFTSRAGIGKTAILRKEGCTNQGFQSIVPHINELDSYFIFSRSEEMKRYGETVGAGSTFVEVSGKQMANMELMMPTTMEEQVTIGSFFSNLDSLITLHQRKSEQEKQKKKALMQLLLTGIVRTK